jgi:hypothetical protein
MASETIYDHPLYYAPYRDDPLFSALQPRMNLAE